MAALQRQQNVLVVDDDPVVGMSFQRVLSGQGYLVTTAENAHEALERMAAAEYDLVFTDLRMPGMDGMAFAQEVRTRRPWTPVVIVTGNATPASEAQARTIGVAEFLHKPLTPEAIEASTAHALHVDAPPARAAAATTLHGAAPTPAAAPAVPMPERAAPAAAAGPASAVAFVATAAAAPFIGLLYAVLLPFAGLALLVAFAVRALCRRATLRFLGDVALFVAAPLIGLAYTLLMPVFGLGVAATLGVRRLAATRAGRAAAPVLRHVALAAAAPFVGLAYVLVFPVAGLAMLGWAAAHRAPRD